MLEELRAGLRQLKAAGSIDTVHLPMTGVHSHPHHAYKSQGGDASHQHQHSHDGDANHDHSHEALDQAAESAERAKQGRHQQGRGRMRLMNSAQEARSAAVWEKAVRDIQKGLK
jgi:ABC-type Zn2+ transport system substrate-binding protein/surface adhesin